MMRNEIGGEEGKVIACALSTRQVLTIRPPQTPPGVDQQKTTKNTIVLFWGGLRTSTKGGEEIPKKRRDKHSY